MLEGIEFLLFSSHKTSTQTLRYSLDNSNYPSILLHVLDDIYPYNPNNQDPKSFLLEELVKYNNTYNKRLKVISVIRNPVERFISSFFQSKCDNEVYFDGKKLENTTVMKHSVEQLYPLFLSSIRNNDSKYYREGMYDLCNVFNTDIFTQIIEKDNYYYYENEYIELYLLNFNYIHDFDYLKKCLPITNLSKMVENNLTEKKIYYPKYKKFKKTILNNSNNLQEVSEIIRNYYANEREFLFYQYFQFAIPNAIPNAIPQSLSYPSMLNIKSFQKQNPYSSFKESFTSPSPPSSPLFSMTLYQKRVFLFFISLFLCLFLLFFRPFFLIPLSPLPFSIKNKQK